MMDRRAPIRYANADGVSIAYRVMGTGPLDLVWVPGLVSNLEMDFEFPLFDRLIERLGPACSSPDRRNSAVRSIRSGCARAQPLSAAGVEGGAGDPASRVGGEEGDDLGDVVRGAEPVEGDGRHDTGF